MNTSEDPNPLTPADALELYRHELCLHRADGQLVVLPGVIGTVIFERGSKPDVRQGILACFDRFAQLFGAHLKGGRAGDGTGGFTKKTKRGMEAIRRTIVETSPYEAVEVVLSSATDPDAAAAYQIKTLTNISADEDRSYPDGWSVKKDDDLGLSYLKFWMPMDYVTTPAGIQGYEDFLRFVCKQLPIRGGYGGLSPILPFNFHSYMPQEWALAQRFSGLEIDSYAFLQPKVYDTVSYEGESMDDMTALYDYLRPGAKIFKYGFVKGVNWYTLLGDLFVDRLSGETAIREFMHYPDIGVERINNCLLIRAGEYPRLGAPEEGLPEPYVFVNRLISKLRNPEPRALHTNVPGNAHANKANTRIWQARFDLPNAPPVPYPPKIVPEPKKN